MKKRTTDILRGQFYHHVRESHPDSVKYDLIRWFDIKELYPECAICKGYDIKLRKEFRRN